MTWILFIGAFAVGFALDRIIVNRWIVEPMRKSKATARRIFDSLGANVDVTLRMDTSESLYIESEEGTTRVHVLSQGPVKIKTNATIIEDLRGDFVTQEWPLVYTHRKLKYPAQDRDEPEGAVHLA